MTTPTTAPPAATAPAVPRLRPRHAAPPRRSDCLDLRPVPRAARAARRHVRALLAEWGLGELGDDAESVTAELVANAVAAHDREHRAAPVRLTVFAIQRTVLLIVRDASNAPPVPATPDYGAEHGRGLLLVAALSASWGWKRAPGGGKIVHALLRGENRGPVH